MKCKNIRDGMVCNEEINGKAMLNGKRICNKCWDRRGYQQEMSEQMKKWLKRHRGENGN